MRKIAATIVLAVLILTSCASLQVYKLGDVIPPLYDISTQTVYVENVTVTNHSTGAAISFDSAADHDLIRMQFEGIRCTREEITEARSPIYTVVFTTRDGDIILYVISDTEFVIGEYCYEAVRFSADLLVLDSLTSK